MRYYFQIILIVSLTYCIPSISQTIPSGTQSPETIVRQLLQFITIDKGTKIDVAGVEALFHPGAMISMLSHNENGDNSLETVPISDFIEMLKDPYYKAGFEEKELYQHVDKYNGIAQVFQTTHATDGEGESQRGITSFQMVQYQGRWWITSLLWTLDDNGKEIPNRYLPK
jgi:hypothetical protein